MRKKKKILVLCLSMMMLFPVNVFAESVEDVTAMLEALPEYPDEDDADDVKEALKAYYALSGANRLSVGIDVSYYTEWYEENYGKDLSSDVSGTETGSEDTESTSSSYEFEVPDEGISISIKYVQDLDGDGVGDVPTITLSSPDGDSITLQEGTNGLTLDTIEAALSWEDTFMQIDISTASEGTWTVKTSSECSFTEMDYVGEQKKLGEDESSEDIDSSAEYEEDVSETNDSALIKLIAIFVILIVGIVFLFKSMTKGADKKDKKNKEEEGTPENPEEEDLEALKRQIAEEMNLYKDEEPEQKKEEEVLQIEEIKEEKDEVVLEELDEYIEYTENFERANEKDEPKKKDRSVWDDEESFTTRFR